jgi:hypothetical protein
MVKRYATLDEMYYDPMKVRPTLGFDTIMQLNQKLGIPNAGAGGVGGASMRMSPEVSDVPPPAAGVSEVGGRTEVGFGHASRFNLDSEGSTSRRRR